jgi:hypothetical protein
MTTRHVRLDTHRFGPWALVTGARTARGGANGPRRGGAGAGVIYAFAPHPDGTEASIRVRGGPGGPARLLGPLMARQVRANITKDLRDLEQRLRDEPT